MAEESTSSAAVSAPKRKLVKRKPARKQVEIGQVEKKAPEQTGSTFNVWYHKWAGGDKYDSYNVKEKSQTRIDVAKDSGYTRADGGNNPYLCLFFSRGCCPYGSECTFLHRLPPPAHVLPDSSSDVFGREKFSEYRDDMGGVGSFTRMNRTLYIGRIKESRNTAEVIERHFEEFGDIERIKILQSRGVAFVTYVSELNAQFAKEAMMCQSLDEDEVINVRWATVDPNPAAARAELAYLKEAGEQGIAKGLDPEFVESIRELDELEGIVEPRAQITLEQEQEEQLVHHLPDEEEEESGQERGGKRRKIEDKKVVEEEVKGVGLLSANAVQSLKFMASLRQNAPPAVKKVPVPVVSNGLSGLAGYGSDEDSD